MSLAVQAPRSSWRPLGEPPGRAAVHGVADAATRTARPAPAVHPAAERPLAINALTLGLLTAAASGPLRLRDPIGPNVQAVISLGGAVGLRGTRGPMVDVPMGGVAAVRGDAVVDAGDTAALLLIRLPGSLLADRGLRLQDGFARQCARSRLCAPLREFAVALLRFGTADAAASDAAERSLVELLVGALLDSDPPQVDGVALRQLLRDRALRMVERDFADPGLRPALVAARLNVSLRHLQRSFEGSGTTISVEIRRARSVHAALLFDTLTGADRSDRRIARLVGFSSADQLRSAFEMHFRVPTSQYRSAHGRIPYLASA